MIVLFLSFRFRLLLRDVLHAQGRARGAERDAQRQDAAGGKEGRKEQYLCTLRDRR